MISQSLLAGIASIVFGIALTRTQDSLGLLSRTAGILEIVLGSCFFLVLLSPLAFALVVPATVIEIVILYKASDFIRRKGRGEV
jgi:hypothetical protein